MQRVGAYLLPDLIHRTAGCDQLFRRADVDAHEAWVAHGRAGDPHVDLPRARGAKPLDGPPRRRAADDRIVNSDQTLALDRARQRVELEHDTGLAQRLVRLD